jgi:hypothetical protein
MTFIDIINNIFSFEILISILLFRFLTWLLCLILIDIRKLSDINVILNYLVMKFIKTFCCFHLIKNIISLFSSQIVFIIKNKS